MITFNLILVMDISSIMDCMRPMRRNETMDIIIENEINYKI